MPRTMRWVGMLAGVAVLGCGSGGEGTVAQQEKNAAGQSSKASDLVLPARDPFPEVTLRTSAGTVKLKLNAEKAPRTVDNFLAYVDGGHYDGTIFHQVDAGYVVVGGSFRPDMSEKRGRYAIRNEADNGLTNRRGTIAMARDPSAIDSSTCQFFVNLADNPALDHRGDTPESFGFCVFGEVIEGMDVVDRIGQSPVRDTPEFSQLPTRTVLIESARRKR